MAEKQTKGKQKIEMKRIENKKDMLVTYSKRRSGINKKASELITLTGSEVAFLAFSPTGKPFSFGHPSFESVVNRFLGEKPLLTNDTTHSTIEAPSQVRIIKLNKELNKELNQLDTRKKKEKELKEKMKVKEYKGWWDRPLEGLSKEELREVEKKFKEVQVELHNKIKKKTGASSSSNSVETTN